MGSRPPMWLDRIWGLNENLPGSLMFDRNSVQSQSEVGLTCPPFHYINVKVQLLMIPTQCGICCCWIKCSWRLILEAAHASHVNPTSDCDWTEFRSNIKLPGKFSFNLQINAVRIALTLYSTYYLPTCSAFPRSLMPTGCCGPSWRDVVHPRWSRSVSPERTGWRSCGRAEPWCCACG